METYAASQPQAIPTRSPIRVLICDDHEIVREGLRTLLAGRADMRVVAEAGNATEAVEAATRETPDVVIMDVRLPDGSGVEACRQIREILPATKVIMLTSYPDDEALYASIVAGASGYLLKQTRARALVEAIDTVSKGRALLDPDVTARVLERVRRGRPWLAWVAAREPGGRPSAPCLAFWPWSAVCTRVAPAGGISFQQTRE